MDLLDRQVHPNEDIISKISLRDSVFTKDNILYNVLIRFPDGSTLKNYNDDQFPVIPFSRDDNLNLKDINLVKSQKIAKILEKLKKDEEKETKENQENNELNNNIIEIDFKNQSIKFKDEIIPLNSLYDNEDNIDEDNKNNEYKDNAKIDKSMNKNKDIDKEKNNNIIINSNKDKKFLLNQNLENKDQIHCLILENNIDKDKIKFTLDDKTNNISQSIENNQLCINREDKYENNKKEEKGAQVNLKNKVKETAINAYIQTKKDKLINSFKNKEILESNLNYISLKKNDKHSQRILDNKKLMKEENDTNKEKQNRDSRNNLLNQRRLNKKLIEKENSEIKKKLKQKKEFLEKKEKEKEKELSNKLKNNKRVNRNDIKLLDNIENNLKKSKINDNFVLFNTSANIDICSQLLKASINNEKQLLFIPYAKKKEKIKKTFNTIGNSNGISYYDYQIIKKDDSDNKNMFNIIREDNKKNLSKMKNYAVTSPMKRTNFLNINKNFDANSEFKI